MLFSKYFNIARNLDDKWFDPIMDHDTNLFIDPFLVFSLGQGKFSGVHDKIKRFFNRAFEIAAQSRGNANSVHFKKLLDMLMFPEVQELCLGYSTLGTSGSGSGSGFSKIMAASILESIAAGLKEVDHFEEVGLFHEGIGCDRISDTTANIVKSELVAYTQQVCLEKSIPMKDVFLRNAYFDENYLRWQDQKVLLPWNEYAKRAILLVPSEFLCQLPTINSDNFWDDFLGRGERLRNDFNYEIKTKTSKRDIIQVARNRAFLVREYVQFVEGRVRAIPYDLEEDPAGLYNWEYETSQYTERHPLELSPPKNSMDFSGVIKCIIEKFTSFIEINGYRLLWREQDKKFKPEEASYLLFNGIITNYCRQNKIHFSRESRHDRDLIRLKFENGFEGQALIKVKTSSTRDAKKNIRPKVVDFLKQEKVLFGAYLILYRSGDEFDRVTKSELMQSVNNLGREIRVKFAIIPIKIHALSTTKNESSEEIDPVHIDNESIVSKKKIGEGISLSKRIVFRTKEEYLEHLVEEYNAVYQQISRTIGEAEVVRLKRHAETLEKQIQQVQTELEAILNKDRN